VRITKRCTRCGKVKPVEYFYSKGAGRRRSECMLCTGEIMALRYRGLPVPTVERSTKVCSVCGLEKSLDQFYKGRGECIDCNRAIQREWRQTNNEYIRERRRWERLSKYFGEEETYEEPS
jgi:hypothetical protein